MSDMPHVQIRRIYDPPRDDDGTRVLVDRLWPRGISKERAHLDEWCKVIAPSTELREWYGHDPERFAEFSRRYRAELGDPEHAEAFTHLSELAKTGTLTLLTATKAPQISEARVLADLLAPGQASSTGQ
jgi:uncharacterized protein YeaO (DUF488 family)